MQGRRLQRSKRSGGSNLRLRSRKAVVAPLAVHSTEADQANKWNPLPSPGSPGSPADRNTKGWTDERGVQNPRLVAQLRNIALAASARADQHATIGLQRDNWNKLCHTTVVTATVAAAALAPSCSITAFVLNFASAGLMVLAGKMQPSQLAEEQRSAANQCRALAAEIEATLLVDPRLREDAHLYVEDKCARLRAVDAAYPLPLLPNGLPKFPAVVRPPVLNAPVNLAEPEMAANGSNGWSPAIAEDLKRTAQKLRDADVEIYLGWARKKERESLRLAVAAPVLVATAALLNVLQCVPAVASAPTATAAALCSAVGMFCFSFAQGGQIGMIFEMYRNCAGSFADMDNTIQRALRMPVCQREDGELFHQKIALQLGRQNHVPLVQPGDKTAGSVF
jgi:hypothetical protein